MSYNVRALLDACLASIFRQNLKRTFDVWVVDNASADGSVDLVRTSYPLAHVLANDANVGFGAATNQGIRASRGRYILVLNPDTELRAGSLDGMIDYLDQHPDVGILGVRLVYPDGRFQHSCFRFPGLWQAFLDLFPVHPRLLDSPLNGRYPRRAYEGEMDIDHCLGACFMLRRAAGLEFDESYFMYAEEIDLCWRLRAAGWKARYAPLLTVAHHAGASTKQAPAAMRAQLFRSRRLFNRRYRGRLFNLAWEAIIRLGRAEQGGPRSPVQANPGSS